MTTYIYYQSKRIKVKIDAGVALDEIINQLLASQRWDTTPSAGASELFCLRNYDTGELITRQNLEEQLGNKQAMRLCESPLLEIVGLLEALDSPPQSAQQISAIKLSAFQLSKIQFSSQIPQLQAFLERNGMLILQKVIQNSTGNTLAYSLQTLQNLLAVRESEAENSNGVEAAAEAVWSRLDPAALVDLLLNVISTEPRLNIVKPALSVLLLLLRSPSQMDERDKRERLVQDHPRFLTATLERLQQSAGGDMLVTEDSLEVLNIIWAGRLMISSFGLGDELYKRGLWEVISHLIELPTTPNLLSQLVSFQFNLLSSLFLQHATPAAPEVIAQAQLLDTVNAWGQIDRQSTRLELSCLAGLRPLPASSADILRTSRAIIHHLAIIFDLKDLFAHRGELKLELNPLCVRFFELHVLGMQLFVRMWNEARAIEVDFDKLNVLAKGFLTDTINSNLSWPEMKQIFARASYTGLRDRVTQNSELINSILNKAAVRDLRSRLYQDSYEYMKSQRVAALLQGSWMHAPALAAQPLSPMSLTFGSIGKKSVGPPTGVAAGWRYYRLSKDLTGLEWGFFPERTLSFLPLDASLPSRLDLSTVTAIVTSPLPRSAHSRSTSVSTTTAPATSPRTSNDKNRSRLNTRLLPSSPPPSPTSVSSPTTFSITLQGKVFSADLYPTDKDSKAEWFDGLNSLLFPDSVMQDSADMIQSLTEIGVLVRLLECGTVNAEAPGEEGIPPPVKGEFYYSEKEHAMVV